MQLLLPVPVLLQLLHLALGQVAAVRQFGWQTLGIPLLVLGITFEELLRRDLGLCPFLFLSLFPCLAS